MRLAIAALLLSTAAAPAASARSLEQIQARDANSAAPPGPRSRRAEGRSWRAAAANDVIGLPCGTTSATPLR